MPLDTQNRLSPAGDKPLLVHHVTRACGIPPRTVRWMAKHGILQGFKDPETPKLWRFRRADVEAFKTQLETAGRRRLRSTKKQ
jgi:hypothetical protein